MLLNFGYAPMQDGFLHWCHLPPYSNTDLIPEALSQEDMMSGVGLQTHELSVSEKGNINLLCSASVKLFSAQVKLDWISLHI